MAADKLCEIEILADEILGIIRDKYNDERFKGEKTALLPKLGEFAFMFGNPALVPCQSGIAVYPETELPIHESGPLPGCPWNLTRTIVIKWWCLDPNFSRAARLVARMGTVIRRIILRNPLIIVTGGVQHSSHTRFARPINIGRDVIEAFTGDRVSYPTGDMALEIENSELLDTDF